MSDSCFEISLGKEKKGSRMVSKDGQIDMSLVI